MWRVTLHSIGCYSRNSDQPIRHRLTNQTNQSDRPIRHRLTNQTDQSVIDQPIRPTNQTNQSVIDQPIRPTNQTDQSDRPISQTDQSVIAIIRLYCRIYARYTFHWSCLLIFGITVIRIVIILISCRVRKKANISVAIKSGSTVLSFDSAVAQLYDSPVVQ